MTLSDILNIVSSTTGKLIPADLFNDMLRLVHLEMLDTYCNMYSEDHKKVMDALKGYVKQTYTSGNLPSDYYTWLSVYTRQGKRVDMQSYQEYADNKASYIQAPSDRYPTAVLVNDKIVIDPPMVCILNYISKNNYPEIRVKNDKGYIEINSTQELLWGESVHQEFVNRLIEKLK